jgi:dTDP-4-amino-4,6-dideoxygalactose transaminase
MIEPKKSCDFSNKKMNSKHLFLSPPHMSGEEITFIREAFESNYIAPLGPMVDAFEKKFAEKVGFHHAVALSSGTAAMHLALKIIGVGPGDEVIASSLTFIGSVTPIVFQGATPVFIDSDRASWNMDPELLAEELEACQRRGKMPKAVVPTEIYGQCANLDRINEICGQYGVPVIIDAAEALGTTYTSKCNRSSVKAAVFSFNGNKILTTSGGGMLASEDSKFIERARFLSQQARDEAPHYEHSEIGYNFRMSNIIAAIGCGQLRVLGDRVKKKREIFDYYFDKLHNMLGIEFMPEAPYGRSNRWLTVILIALDKFGADREAVRIALEAENIESRPVWKPLHLQPVFQYYENEVSELETNDFYNSALTGGKAFCRVVGGKVAEDLFERGLCLPSGTQLSTEDLERIISIIISCRKES